MAKKSIWFISSFLCGVFLSSHYNSFSLNSSLVLFLIFLNVILFFVFPLKRRFVPLLIISFILGFLYPSLFQKINEKHILDYFAENNIALEYKGRINSLPLQKTSHQELKVEILSLTKFPEETISTTALVKAPPGNELFYGETIAFSAIPKKPEVFSTDSGKTFDYPHYLEKDGIFYLMKTSSVESLAPPKKNILFYLYKLKQSFLKKIYKELPRPQSSLLAGVLLGEKTALGTAVEESFRDTGLMHIVVLSGYNVSLVIMAIMILLAPLPLSVRSLLASLGIITFALLVGAGPTVIRASIMAFFIVLGTLLGRDYHVERGLLLAGFLMVLYNPLTLYFDLSFQLSFLATYGLIIFPPLLEKYFLWVPQFLYFRESLIATISAQIMVIPLIMYTMGNVSLISPIVNMLVLFMVPIVMLLGFIMVISSFIFPFITSFFSFLSLIGLSYILFLVDFFSKIPLAHTEIPAFPFWILVFLYSMIFFCYQEKQIYKIKMIMLYFSHGKTYYYDFWKIRKWKEQYR